MCHTTGVASPRSRRYSVCRRPEAESLGMRQTSRFPGTLINACQDLGIFLLLTHLQFRPSSMLRAEADVS